MIKRHEFENLHTDSAPCNGPYRPLYVEAGRPVRVHYELTEEELQEAISDWLENHHNQSVEWNDCRVICTFDSDPSNKNSTRTVKKGFFNQYQICLEVDV